MALKLLLCFDLLIEKPSDRSFQVQPTTLDGTEKTGK